LLRFYRRFLQSALCWAFLGIFALSRPTLASPHAFEFLYINASEGTASGGHAAIKFDNEVFHFQHIEPGLLRVYRDHFPAFRFAYGYQENRTIRGHKILVEHDVFQMLRDAFNRRYLIQNQQFGLLAQFDADRRLLAGLKLNAKPNPKPTDAPTIELKGLGYFLKDYRPGAFNAYANKTTKSPQILQLKQAINRKYGSGFLAEKRQHTRRQFLALKPASPETIAHLAEDRFQPEKLSFAERYKHGLLNLAALDILESGTPPLAETLLTASSPEFFLNEKATATLEGFKNALFADLIGLMQSQRSDWGYPFLVGMARLHVLAQSMAEKKLVVLERFHPLDTNRPALDITAKDLPAVLAFAEKSMASATGRLAEATVLDEPGYGEIEASANTYLGITAATRQQKTVQIPYLSSTPETAAKAALVPLPLADAELEDLQRLLTQHSKAVQKQLGSIYRYHLFDRNCVTEIFRIINASLSQQNNPVQQTSGRLLGGYIEPGNFNSIPFAAFDAVGRRYRIQSSYRLPTYRERQIAHEYLTSADTLVNLSESNVLTSSIYHWHGEDAAFLFFTQDAVWSRPIFGGINLAVAIGQSLYGALAWPWDSGKNFQKSLKGIAVSLPELVFFNIRKGSFPQLIPHISTPIDLETQ